MREAFAAGAPVGSEDSMSTTTMLSVIVQPWSQVAAVRATITTTSRHRQDRGDRGRSVPLGSGSAGEAIVCSPFDVGGDGNPGLTNYHDCLDIVKGTAASTLA